MNELPPVVQARATPKPGKFLRYGAIFSLLAPFVVTLVYIILFAFMESHGHTRMWVLAVLGMLPLLLILAGFAIGIMAVVQIKRRESKTLFGVALAGLCLNSLFLVLLVVSPFLLRLAQSDKNYPTTPQGRLDRALKKLNASGAGIDRFYALDDAAKESFVVGNVEDARKYAAELLSLAPTYPNDWNYGNAIQDGNLVLGRIAVREGKLEQAKEYLLAAGRSKGSPQMDSFGPNMSLAKDLLEKGEKDVVLQYFELCRKFWEDDYGKLDDWSKEVKAGNLPDFGANLVY